MECACRHRVTSLQTAVREAGRGPAGPELTADAGIGPLLPPACPFQGCAGIKRS